MPFFILATVITSITINCSADRVLNIAFNTWPPTSSPPSSTWSPSSTSPRTRWLSLEFYDSFSYCRHVSKVETTHLHFFIQISPRFPGCPPLLGPRPGIFSSATSRQWSTCPAGSSKVTFLFSSFLLIALILSFLCHLGSIRSVTSPLSTRVASGI